VLLLWCGFATSAPLLTPLVATGTSLVTPFCTVRASLVTPFCTVRTSLLTPFCAGLRAGRCWRSSLRLGFRI
jgi:hypothetical protein